jgi:type VI protein secretion system component VasF
MTEPLYDDDDVLPEQRGKAPLEAEIAERYAAGQATGRWWRLRSWITVAVAAVAVIVCFWLLRKTL